MKRGERFFIINILEFFIISLGIVGNIELGVAIPLWGMILYFKSALMLILLIYTFMRKEEERNGI